MNNVNIFPLCSPSGAETHYGAEVADSVRNLTFYMGVNYNTPKPGPSHILLGVMIYSHQSKCV